MREEFYKNLLKDCSGIYFEIGTCFGGFTEFLRLHTPATQITTIDPYRKFTREEYCDALNDMTQEQMDKKHEMVAARLLNFKPGLPTIYMWRMTSYKAAGLVPDNFAAFVYLDGNHHYNAVLCDLIRWWPKVRKGGFLCGDDVEEIKKEHDDEGNLFVTHQPGSYGKYGVHQALIDFAKICPDFRYEITGNQFVARK